MVDNDRISAITLAFGPAYFLGEGGSVVGQEELLHRHRLRDTEFFVRCESYNVVSFHIICFAPSAHDKRVIVRDNSDGIHTFGLDFRQLLDEARQMAHGTAGCECT